MARRGMIATSQPLASATGLRILNHGGNAVDAAVAAAAVLAVVEPTMTGPGGDLFAIVHDGRTGKLSGLNGSGRSAYAASCEAFSRRALDRIPTGGVLSVSVPGAVDGWATLLEAHGTISLAQALAPAIEYARNGFPVAEIVSCQWQAVEDVLAADPPARKTFLPGGRAPRPGEVFRNPALAATLAQIAEGGRDAFYKGPIAEALLADIGRRDGLLDARDLADHRSDWVDPISTSYRGYEILEMPPNTQGFVPLEMLNILEGFEPGRLGHNSAAYLHLLVEAKRIAFADRARYLADRAEVPETVLRTLISKAYAQERRAGIDPARAARDYEPAAFAARPRAGVTAAPGRRGDELTSRARGDTVYLTAADHQGTVISLIQSIFENFGAGIVAGETGVVLHNRGCLFTLDPEHPNCVAAHKRPMHTLIPGMVRKDGRPWLSFGVMGADMQPQGHVQLLVNLIDFGMNVQEAGEAARVRHAPDGVALETAIPPSVASDLATRGHALVDAPGVFGGFQAILIDPETGVLMGGSDPRKDGLAVGC